MIRRSTCGAGWCSTSGEPLRLEKSLFLADFTTRKRYPGFHHLELLINGEARPPASFELLGG